MSVPICSGRRSALIQYADSLCSYVPSERLHFELLRHSFVDRCKGRPFLLALSLSYALSGLGALERHFNCAQPTEDCRRVFERGYIRQCLERRCFNARREAKIV